MPFSNAAWNFRQLAKSPMSWAAALMMLGIHAGVAAGRAGFFYECFGLTREAFLSGQIWRIFSYGLLHGSWVHAGLNSLFLLLIGFRIEQMAGRPVLLKVIVFGILGGGVGHLALAPGGSEAPLLVGMSGACVALVLLLTTLSPQSRMMPLPVSGKSLGLGILSAELFLALIHPEAEVPGFSIIGNAFVDAGWGAGFQIGHACHFGGGIAGWLAGRWILRPRVTLKQLRQERARREPMDSRHAE